MLVSFRFCVFLLLWFVVAFVCTFGLWVCARCFVAFALCWCACCVCLLFVLDVFSFVFAVELCVLCLCLVLACGLWIVAFVWFGLVGFVVVWCWCVLL